MTITRMRGTVLLALCAAAVTGPAAAHHSFAMFDMGKTVAISGTVKDWVWANPHSWLYVTVQKPNGTTEDWGFEASSPNMMIRWGWNASDINVGDKVTVDTHPARDGKHVGSVYAVFLANGKVLADPMGRQVRGRELAEGPPSLPTKPTGTPYP